MNLNNEDWTYDFDISREVKKVSDKIETEIHMFTNRVLKLFDSCFNIGKFNVNGNNTASKDIDLDSLIDKNRVLSEEVDAITEEIKECQIQYENYKQDYKLLSEEIKDTYESYLMAKKFYKKHLKLYYNIESSSDTEQIVFLQFFTEIKIKSEKDSVRLRRNTKTGSFEIMEMNPKLTIYEDIQKKLQETNDVSGALCCIRKSFLLLKNN